MAGKEAESDVLASEKIRTGADYGNRTELAVSPKKMRQELDVYGRTSVGTQ